MKQEKPEGTPANKVWDEELKERKLIAKLMEEFEWPRNLVEYCIGMLRRYWKWENERETKL